MHDPAPSRAATIQGMGAILLWATLASLTALSGSIPALQLTAMSFALASAVGVAYAFVTGQSLHALRTVPLRAWALGVYGLLGYHASYFFAVKSAPPVEVTIINYMWPLLIVLFSALLPAGKGGGPLRWWHVAGSALGFLGAALIPLGAGGGLELSGSTLGYAAAMLAAVIWSSYSVASRLFAHVPTTAVAGTCAMTAIGALVLHLAFERTVWPLSAGQWLVVLACGLGPVGIAFFLWDAGVKRGNLRLLGALSYATPLLATVLLAVLGLGHITPIVGLAALLVTGGALLAALDMWRKGAIRSAGNSRPEEAR